MEELTNEEKYDFEISHLITEVRIEKGLTQEKLAKLMGTKQPSIARAERGSSRPSHLFLQKLAQVSGGILNPPTITFPSK